MSWKRHPDRGVGQGVGEGRQAIPMTRIMLVNYDGQHVIMLACRCLAEAVHVCAALQFTQISVC